MHRQRLALWTEVVGKSEDLSCFRQKLEGIPLCGVVVKEVREYCNLSSHRKDLVSNSLQLASVRPASPPPAHATTRAEAMTVCMCTPQAVSPSNTAAMTS